MKVGTASYGSQKKRFKIKDGDNIFRILPPLGEMADLGKWFKYYRVEWGYRTSDGKNKPFLDCRKFNFETKEVEVESAAFLRRDEIRNAKDAVNKQLKTNPSDPTLLEKKKALGDLGMRYNCENKYYLNVVNEQGEIGLLKIGKRAMDGLQGQIKEFREKRGADPMGLVGTYFNFYRTGTGLETIYTVTPYREMLQDGSERIKSHTMDEGFISRLSSEAFELSGMYPTLTPDQVKRLAEEGETAVDEIFASKTTETKTTTVEETLAPEEVAEVLSTPTSTLDLPVTAAPVASSTLQQAPVAEVANEATMNEKDFLASLGVSV